MLVHNSNQPKRKCIKAKTTNLLILLLVNRRFGVDFLGHEVFAPDRPDRVLDRFLAIRLLPLLGVILP